MLKEDRQSQNVVIGKMKTEHFNMDKKIEGLLQLKLEHEEAIEALKDRLRYFEGKRKVPLLVFKQIYNEVKDPVGHAYVEELRTVRGD
jgi:hypothetical protein